MNDNDYWDNIPDLDLPGGRRQKKRPPAANEDVVIYTKVRCPKCGSDKCPVYDSSHLPIRYHKCSDPNCGYTFKSIEENYKSS